MITWTSTVLTILTPQSCSALVLASAAALAVPRAAANKEQRQMMADIRMLQEQAQQLQSICSAIARREALRR